MVNKFNFAAGDSLTFENTEYWVDITTDGVTCRESITISVIDINPPTEIKSII